MLPGKIELLFELKKYTDIVELYKKESLLFNKRIPLKKIYALSLAKLNRHKESDSVFIELNQTCPFDTEIAFYAINAFIQKKDLHNAIGVANTVLTEHHNKHNAFIFYFLKAQIYMQTNNMANAKSEIKKALELNPNFDKGWLLFSVLAEQEQSWSQAIQGYNTFLSLQDDSSSYYQIQNHLLELALAQKKSNAKTTVPSLIANRFNEALIYFQDKHYNQALSCIDQCLTQEDNKTYALLKIEILAHLKQYTQLADYCHLCLDKKDADKAYWYNVIHLIAHKENQFIPFAINLLQKKITQFDSLMPSFYLADIYTKEKEWKKAASLLEKIISHIQDPALLCTTKHQLAVTYFMEQKNDAAILLLQKILAENPGHLASLNLLAHLYITDKKNLHKAEKLILKARIIDAQNPHLMDTHALLLYEQGALLEAKNLFNNALALAPDDATIILHLAQVAHTENDLTQAKLLLTRGKEKAYFHHEHQMAQELDNRWFPRQ